MASEKELLRALEKDTVDTASWTVDDESAAKEAFELADSRLRGGVAIPQVDGTLRAWHVTDDPGQVIEILDGRKEYHPREGDLCTGLYVSANPSYWRGRSQRRWEFMKTLSPDALEALISGVAERIEEQKASGYITSSEHENASRILKEAKGYWPVLSILSDQPYNVNIQKIAKERGIAEPLPAIEVPVDFEGRYLEFNTKRAIDAYMELLRKRYGTLEGVTRADLCDMLEEHGWDGIFTQSGFGTNPELVIWDPKKIIAFGDWMRGASAEMAGPNSRTVVFDPFGDQRFEADLSIARRLADIRDTKRKLIIPVFNKGNVGALRSTIARLLAEGGPIGAVPAPVKKLLTGLDRDDLQNLFDLTDRLLELMQ